MWFFGLGILVGIGIYWAIAIILARSVLNRHIEKADYLSILWHSEIPKDKKEAVPHRPETDPQRSLRHHSQHSVRSRP
jgi:hypothetical protein